MEARLVMGFPRSYEPVAIPIKDIKYRKRAVKPVINVTTESQSPGLNRYKYINLVYFGVRSGQRTATP